MPRFPALYHSDSSGTHFRAVLRMDTWCPPVPGAGRTGSRQVPAPGHRPEPPSWFEPSVPIIFAQHEGEPQQIKSPAAPGRRQKKSAGLLKNGQTPFPKPGADSQSWRQGPSSRELHPRPAAPEPDPPARGPQPDLTRVSHSREAWSLPGSRPSLPPWRSSSLLRQVTRTGPTFAYVEAIWCFLMFFFFSPLFH